MEEKELTPFEVFQENAEAKRAELEAIHKVKVTAFIVNVSGDFPENPFSVAFLKDPQRIVKMKAVDALDQSGTMAGDMILNSCLLPESDPRILNDDPKYDTLYMTMIGKARELVTYYSIVVKKN